MLNIAFLMVNCFLTLSFTRFVLCKLLYTYLYNFPLLVKQKVCGPLMSTKVAF